ncbi:MAG: hypothetical protein DRP35_00760 [Candidatus Zixiibacteriota bacterium]|nr:MAG: hypothetical protein DRP35_00760 [candidate division Zixibacteria bacterium]
MLDNTSDVQQLYRVEAMLESCRADLRDISTMGAVITSIHKIDAVLSVAMDMAIRLVNGEVGLIMLEENNELSLKISWGIDDAFVKSLIYQDDEDIASYCFRTRESVLLNNLGIKIDSGFNINSIITAPIKTSDNCFGIVVVINKADETEYSNDDKELLENLLSFVAVAIDNSLLMKEKLLRQKIDQEMAIAKQIQETILPTSIDTVPGLDIGAVYFPANDVGGDFYDVIKIDEKNIMVIIGDVSNKGIPAAMVMSAAAAIIKTKVAECPDIEIFQLAEFVNDSLSEQIIKDKEMFVTLFFSKFDFDKKELTYCNAGHVPGLFWDNEKKIVVELPEGGTIVGQFHGIPFKQGSRRLKAGDRLFVFTDGLTESEDADGQLFGRERAEQVFYHEIGLPPKEFCSKVREWIDKFAEGAKEESIDDFTILQVEVKSDD